MPCSELRNAVIPPAVTTLMEVQVPVTNPAQCKQAYGSLKTALIDDTVICAGYPEGGKDSCRVQTPSKFRYFRRLLLCFISHRYRMIYQCFRAIPEVRWCYRRAIGFIWSALCLTGRRNAACRDIRVCTPECRRLPIGLWRKWTKINEKS